MLGAVDTTWQFDQPPNCAVLTVRGILEDGEPVLHVIHDEEDHGWQFLGAETPNETDARIVALNEMLSLDPSLHELADLPVGWHAWRERCGDSWVREPCQR
jgi:hypothetical protein